MTSREWSQQNGTAINARGGTYRRPPSLRACADSVHREHDAIVVAIEQRDVDAEFGWCPTLVGKLGGRAELLAL
jgi:hypothetical protein